MVEERVLRCALSGALLYSPVLANRLMNEFSSADEVFGKTMEELEKIIGNKNDAQKVFYAKTCIDWARQEMEWAGEKNVSVIFRGDENYPSLLYECDDAPQMLFYRGNADLNEKNSISVVGTRLASSYGRECCNEIVRHLVPYKPLVCSGLAYGIDVSIHKAALENGLQTLAVLPNGIDVIYPPKHRNIAAQMLNCGGVITEFPRGFEPKKMNFIKRNRIIAAISQALIVVETRVKGGSMSTVEFANMYNRDIFAVPGRLTDSNSYGCNYLISKNVACIYNSPSCVPAALMWKGADVNDVELQPKLFSFDVDNKEKILLSLNSNKAENIDRICALTKLDWSVASMLLLELELEGKVELLNGCEYILKKL